MAQSGCGWPCGGYPLDVFLCSVPCGLMERQREESERSEPEPGVSVVPSVGLREGALCMHEPL